MSWASGPEVSSTKCSCRKGLMVLVALRSRLRPMTTGDSTVRTEAVNLSGVEFHGKQRLDGNFDRLGRRCQLFRLEGLQKWSHCGAWRVVRGYGVRTPKSQSFYALALILDIIKIPSFRGPRSDKLTPSMLASSLRRCSAHRYQLHFAPFPRFGRANSHPVSHPWESLGTQLERR